MQSSSLRRFRGEGRSKKKKIIKRVRQLESFIPATGKWRTIKRMEIREVQTVSQGTAEATCKSPRLRVELLATGEPIERIWSIGGLRTN